MFKKIFRSSGGYPHDFGGLRKSYGSQKDSLTSSSGQETETASVTDTHNHENRHFLGKPLRDNSKTSETEEQDVSDTWDPFDSKHTMRKSKSFSFKFRPQVSPTSMTKSRSVHFADDLASYQAEMKLLHEKERLSRDKEQEYSESEDSSENSGDMCQGDVVMDRQPSEDENDVEVSQSGTETESNESSQGSKSLSSSDSYSRSEKSKTLQTGTRKFDTVFQSPSEREGSEHSELSVNKRQARRTRKAGKVLQSFFPEEESKSEKVESEKRQVSKVDRGPVEGGSGDVDGDFSKPKSGKNPNVNFSDSTDVESAEDLPNNALSILFPIYKQIYRMIQLEHKEEASCNLDQLQRDVTEGLMDLDQTISSTKAQTLNMQTEMRNLKESLLTCEEKWKQMQIENEEEVPKEELKALIKKQQTQLDQQSEAADSAAQAHQKTIVKLNEKLASVEEQKVRLDEQHAKEVEVWTKKIELSAKENQELSRQIRTLYRKTKEVDQFQAAESRILMETNTRLEAAAKTSQCEKEVLQAREVELEAQLAKHHTRIAEQQELAKEQEQQLQNLQTKREAEKKEEQEFNLALKREFKEMKESKQQLSVKCGETEKALQTQQEKIQKLVLDLHTAQSMGENFRREAEKLRQEVRDRNMDLGAVRFSNQVAVANLQQIIHQSYRILAPRFQPESTRNFSQIYSELAKIKLIDGSNKGVVVILLAFLQTALADLVRQYEQNEEALGAEVDNRRRFQEEVLSTFRSIVKQIVGMNREKRPRSPKKKKGFK